MLRLQPRSPAQVILAVSREQQQSRWVVMVDGSLKGWVDALHESWMRQLCHWPSADRADAWKCPVCSKMAESDGGDFTSNHPQNRWGRSVRTWELCKPEFGSTADSSKCRGCVAYLSTYCLSCLTCGRNGFPCVPWWFCRGTGGSRCGGTGSHCLSRVMGLMGLGISVRQGLVVAYGKTFGCIWLILGCVMIVVIRSPWRRWRHFLNFPLGVCPVPSVPIICVRYMDQLSLTITFASYRFKKLYFPLVPL